MAGDIEKYKRRFVAPFVKCGPSPAQVRTSQERLKDTLVGIEEKLVQDPFLLKHLPPLPTPTPPKTSENPGWANLRRMNWERRVKRLKRDWYGKDAA